VFPEWLAAGLALTGLLAVAFAAVFVAGERLFPTAPVEPGDDRSGEWKRREEIRAYLSAIGERYAEDHPVAGEAVAFYLPVRDVAITFDAQAYFRIEQTPTYAILVEHELPGTGIGARLPFEVPPVDGFDADARESAEGETGGEQAADEDAPGGHQYEAAFRELGLDPGATDEQVRQAYRTRVKEVHPDHGGDREAFRRVREAYTTARKHAT
jgi:hypothetical protein